MTSGNLSDEPIAHDDGDATTRLGPLVDGLLTHDRPIHIRCDDSVARATGTRIADAASVARVRARTVGAADARAASGPGRGCRAEEHDRGRERRHGGCQPSHRRSRAPADVPIVRAGAGSSPSPVRRDARRRCPRPASGVLVDEARARARPPDARCAASSRARRVVPRRARPHGAGAGPRVRRHGLRPRRHDVGRRVPRRRPRRLRPGRSPASGDDARWRGGDPRALAHGARVGDPRRRRRPSRRRVRRGRRPPPRGSARARSTARTVRSRRAWAGCSTRWRRCWAAGGA